MQKFLTSLGTAGGIVIIMMALLFMLLNFFGGLLIFGAGLLGLPRIRNKLKITGKKAFGMGFVLYIVGFSLVVAFTEAPERQPEMVQSTPKPQNTPKPQSIEPKPVDEVPQATVEPVTEPVAQTVVVPAPIVTTPPVVAENEKAVSKYDVSCKIVGVSDGDTATCLTNDKKQIKIRFDQIDAPETGQDFGSASKKALSDMIFGKTVELDTKEQDKYGRTVAEVFVDDKNINKEMVALGMAWAYREYVKDNEYIDLETKARRDSLGLWSQPDAIYPSDFRRGKRGEQSIPTQTQQIAQSQEKRDLADSGGKCGSKRTCKQMSSCAEAKHYLNVCGLSRLDRDGDSIPCETLCK